MRLQLYDKGSKKVDPHFNVTSGKDSLGHWTNDSPINVASITTATRLQVNPEMTA